MHLHTQIHFLAHQDRHLLAEIQEVLGDLAVCLGEVQAACPEVDLAGDLAVFPAAG